MSIWEYLLLFFSVVLGGGLALVFKTYEKRVLSLVLSFSGSYLLGITVLHLMPGVFSDPEVSIGIWVLVGFFIQLLLEQLSIGVEHGHIHAHKHASTSFAFQVMLGLCLHAFLEGLPLSNYPEFHAHHHDLEHNHNHLLYGIILHKAPAAFALVILLMLSKFSKKVIILSLVLFASMSPLGAIIMEYMHFSEQLLSSLIAIVIGSFLHISTTILFEADDTHQHKVSWKKMLVILSGIGIALLTLV